MKAIVLLVANLLQWSQARTVEAGGKALSKTFTRRLIWRDLAYWQLHHWPAMSAVPMRPHYAAQVSGFFLSCE